MTAGALYRGRWRLKAEQPLCLDGGGATPADAQKDRHSRRAGASGGTRSESDYRVVRALAVFEYGESPVALCARTRYVYVVRDARPLSLYVVAVPATTAIWTKFVQLEPVQRWMRTSV